MLTEKNSSKRGRGRRPTGIGAVIGLRLHEPVEKALAAWIKEQGELSLTKQEAIRRLLAKALKDQGYLKKS